MQGKETKVTLIFLDRLRPRLDPPRNPVFEGLAQVRAYWEGMRCDEPHRPHHGRLALHQFNLAGGLVVRLHAECEGYRSPLGALEIDVPLERRVADLLAIQRHEGAWRDGLDLQTRRSHGGRR